MASSKQNGSVQTITQDLPSSNFTTARFVGNAQKPWMSAAHAKDSRAPGASRNSCTPVSPRPATTHHTFERIPRAGQSIQPATDTAGNAPASALPLSPDCDRDHLPVDKRECPNGKGISRKSSTQVSGSHNKKLKVHPSVVTEELGLQSRTITSLPSPTPSHEISREDENATVSDRRPSQASSTPVDLITCQDIQLKGFDPTLDVGHQLSARAGPMAPPPLSAIPQEPPLLSEPLNGAAPHIDAVEATAREHPDHLATHAPVHGRTRNTTALLMKAGQSSNPTQINTPSSGSGRATSLNDFKKYHVRVTARMNWLSRGASCEPVEASRLRLLQQACDAGDTFFLVLHRLFCKKHLSRSLGSDLQDVERGFQALGFLLAANEDMTSDAILWFSNFAMSPFRADQKQMETVVLRFLGSLANQWGELKAAHPRHTIPPSSVIILAKLPGVESMVLQQVLFRAILRISWVELQDECFRLCEQVFINNQRAVQVHLKQECPEERSNRAVLGELSQLAMQDFQKVLVSHFAHSTESQITADAPNVSPNSTEPPQIRIDSSNAGVFRHHNSTGVDQVAERRPALPNLNVQAAEQSHVDGLCGGCVVSSPFVLGPYSAPLISACRSSYPMQSSAPPTPAAMNSHPTSRPTSIAPPLLETQLEQHSHRIPSSPSQQKPNSQQAFQMTSIVSSNIPRMPNNSSTPAMPYLTLPGPEHQTSQVPQAQPTALVQRASRMQQTAQTNQGAQVQQAPPAQQTAEMHAARQMQQIAKTRQTGQIQETPHVQQKTPLRQHIPVNQTPQMQQYPYMRSGLSSNQPSIPFTSTGPVSQGIHFQQMSPFGNAPGFGQQGNMQPLTAQQSPVFPQTNFSLHLGGVTTNYSAANIPIPSTLFNTAASDVQPMRQVANTDQFISISSAPRPRVPNPGTSALHQAHAKTPQLGFWDPNNPHENTKSFRYIKNVSFYDSLSNWMQSLQWSHKINDNDFKKFAKDITGPIGLPFRQVSNGTYLARLRCIKLKGCDKFPSESDWATSDMCWPPYVVMSVNKRFLEIRRKSHYGKDLPVDVTGMLKPGQNDFSSAVLGLPPDCTDQWLIGLEIIEVADAARIKEMLTFQTYSDCRNRILSKLRSTDPDVEIVQAQTVLDLTDPFTSRIFDIPVRGKDCAHYQCFDLDTFLETRGNMNKAEPCLADEFRCPICRGDVRPQMMVVDGCFVFLQRELARRERLDAKAVILQEDGTWEIRDEQEKKGEEGDGSGRRQRSDSDLTGAAKTDIGTASNKGKGKDKALVETINLDDD